MLQKILTSTLLICSLNASAVTNDFLPLDQIYGAPLFWIKNKGDKFYVSSRCLAINEVVFGLLPKNLNEAEILLKNDLGHSMRIWRIEMKVLGKDFGFSEDVIEKQYRELKSMYKKKFHNNPSIESSENNDFIFCKVGIGAIISYSWFKKSIDSFQSE